MVPRMVAPRGRIPETSLSVSSNDFSGQMRPSKPSGMPMTFHLYFRMAALVAARMTALRPGASPPSVAIPMQRMVDVVGVITRSAALYIRAPPNGSCVRSHRSMRKDCHITSGHGKKARVIKPGALDLGRLRQKNSDVMATV